MKKKILVADGDPVFAGLLARELEAKGWRVDTALDPVQTLDAAFRTPPDAIVLDLKMPTGLFALRRLKTSSRTSAAKVVAVAAASADPALPRAAAAFGAKAFLRKPVSAEEVYAILCWALSEPEPAKDRLPDDELEPAAGGAGSIPILGAGNLP